MGRLSNEFHAWAGKMLHIDLTRGKIWITTFPKKMGVKFLGARGMNAKLLWDLVSPEIDALSPEPINR